MNSKSDRELVAACLAGDADAFAVLMRRYWAHVYAIAYATRLRHEDAQDVAQECFIRAFSHLEQLKTPDKFEGWICRIARTCSQNEWRRPYRQRETAMGDALPVVPAPVVEQERFETDEDMQRFISEALGHLPDKFRIPLAMRYFGDLSVEDIASSLALSPEAVEMRLSRAREWLRQYFVRRGLEQECLELLQSHAWMVGFSAEMAEAVMNAVRKTPPPISHRISAEMFVVGMWSVVLGVIIGLGPVDEPPITLENPRDMWVDLVAFNEKMMVPVENLPRGKPRRADILHPVNGGNEWVGWLPAEPRKDNSGVSEQSDYYRSGRSGAVLRNAYGVRKRFESVEGEITLELWVKPPRDEVNFYLGLLLEGVSDDGWLIGKNETNRWMVHDSGFDLGAVAGKGHDIKLVYRTRIATFDASMDGVKVVENAPLRETFVGRRVVGIAMTSGRGNAGSPAYFDDLSVMAEPETSTRLSRPSVLPSPPRYDRLVVVSGMLNGASLGNVPELRTGPGQRIQGFLTLDALNNHPPNTDFSVVFVPGWGDRTENYAMCSPLLKPGMSRLNVPVSVTAPTQAGVYYLWFVGTAEPKPDFAASGTNWPVGRAVFHDGNDVADWGEEIYQATRASGWTPVSMLEDNGKFNPDVHVGAVAIKVIVGESIPPESRMSGF